MSDPAIFERIRDDLATHPVVLYMKGNPIFPQCGFSAAVVEILDYLDVSFQSFDVLSDPSLRDGIKEFARWPTIPQLYVKGEFLGGSDILRELYASGEFTALLRQHGIGFQDKPVKLP